MGLALFAAMPVLLNKKRLSMYIPSKGKKSSVNIFMDNLQSIWGLVSMEVCG
mgnify:CR=1 FL=1